MESTTQPSRCFTYYPYDLDAMMIQNNLFDHQLSMYNDFAMWEQELLIKYCFWAQIEDNNWIIDAQTVIPRRNIVKPKGNKVLLLNTNNFPYKADKLLETIQSIAFSDIK